MADLFRKYRVERGGEVVSDRTMTFTLVPETDEAARLALYVYAGATDDAGLAAALKSRLRTNDFSPLPEE